MHQAIKFKLDILPHTWLILWLLTFIFFVLCLIMPILLLVLLLIIVFGGLLRRLRVVGFSVKFINLI